MVTGVSVVTIAAPQETTRAARVPTQPGGVPTGL
jgi:hypothetical protein